MDKTSLIISIVLGIIIVSAVGYAINMTIAEHIISDDDSDFFPNSSGKYTVTYDIGDGTGSIIDSQRYNSGDIVVVTSEVPSRDGYVFEYWYDIYNFSDKLQGGDTFKITRNTTLYADWSHVYTVTYDLNGASGSIIDNTLYRSGSQVTITEDEPVRDGYIFEGWASNPTYSSSNYSKNIFTIYDNTTLYAIWYPVINYSYSLDFIKSFSYKSSYSGYNNSEDAKDGYQFAVAKLTVKNLTYSKGYRPSYGSFMLETSDGTAYKSSYLVTSHYNYDKMNIIMPDTIGIGVQFTFYVVYQIPDSSAKCILVPDDGYLTYEYVLIS